MSGLRETVETDNASANVPEEINNMIKVIEECVADKHELDLCKTERANNDATQKNQAITDMEIAIVGSTNDIEEPDFS